MADLLLVERRGPVCLLTLNRPESRNAINDALAFAVADALTTFDADPLLRVAVITGAPPGFSAGMDLKAFAAGERGVAGTGGFAGITRQPPEKPIIAAVEGFALAGGLEIALACDLIVSARDARFGLPEVRLGIVAAAGGLLRLPSRIAYHAAAELVLTGAPIDAERAYALGLVNRLTGPGAALETALVLASEIAQNGPTALAVTKRLLTRAAGSPTSEDWDEHDAVAEIALGSDEAREGAIAFAERREPSWRSPEPS